MSEELIQRGTVEKLGKWDYFNIGSTTIRQLKENGIIRNMDYGNYEKNKVDGIVVLKKNVIAIIEYKKPSEFNTKKKQEKAINQELEVARKLKAALLVATDGSQSIWINVLTGNRIKTEAGDDVAVNFSLTDDSLPHLMEAICSSINSNNDQTKPITLVNPTGLAKQIWQDIWSVSGATPENCLYTFVELFIFKYLSDLGVLRGSYSFETLFASYETNTENEVLENYASTIRRKIKELFPENTLDKTTIINGTIFVSKDQKAVTGYSGVFRKILKRFKEYGVLENIDYDFKSKLFESFLKESISKANWGQFFTPLRVVRAIVKMAQDEIKVGIKICDPACGVGKFLLEPIFTRLNEFYKMEGSTLTPKITLVGFDKGFDKDEQKTIILAKANMLIYFSDMMKKYPNSTEEFSKLFNESFLLKTNSILGTLAEPTEDEYDLILTNPPYVTSGSRNLKDEIKKNSELETYFRVNGMGVEGLFLEWIVRALKPNGKAFVVVPDGIFNRQNDSKLRQFLKEECYLDGIISLPLRTFFTTSKKTYILAITKKADKSSAQTHPVFTYLVSEIGESRDVYRFDIEENDLQEAVQLYLSYKGNKSNFSRINMDKRCKLQPIMRFDPDEHWSVDRWWSDQEKIELGIMEEKNIVTPIEFGERLGEIAESLNEFKQLLEVEASSDDCELNEGVEPKKKVALSDQNLFELFLGKRLLKRDLVHIEGTIPIYSANVLTPWAYHYKSNIADFTNDFVIWGIDGDFDFNHIKSGKSFGTTDHCGTIRIKDKYILPEYLVSQLYVVKHKYDFDRGLRASLKNMRAIEIDIPVDEHGYWDVLAQKRVVKKFVLINEMNIAIREHEKRLSKLHVSIDTGASSKLYPLTSLFDIKKGVGYYTKAYGNKNPGEYPVYSASNKSILTHINSYDYDGIYLSWATNGFAGYMKKIKGRFSINADRALLVPKRSDIDIDYVKYTLEPLLRNLAKGRKGDMGEDEFTKVYPTMVSQVQIEIPLSENGTPNMEKQRKIAAEYRRIEKIRREIHDSINELLDSTVEYTY